MYRVLLVDDDPHILRVNEAYLKKRGYQVYSVQDGTAALAVAETAELDAVILDVDMPGLDGITVCRRLRELRTVPVVFLSAYAKTDDRIRGLQAGGDDYLAKPYSLVELELRLRRAISEYAPSSAGRYCILTGWRSTRSCGRPAAAGRSPPSRRWSLIFWPF